MERTGKLILVVSGAKNTNHELATDGVNYQVAESKEAPGAKLQDKAKEN